MLFRRRANYSSASCLYRRANDEIAANGVYTLAGQYTTTYIILLLTRTYMLIHHSILRRPSSYLAWRSFPTMQTHAPPTTSPISPATSCRWKRGRPVPVQYGSAKSVSGTSAMRSPHPLSQATIQDPVGHISPSRGGRPSDGQSVYQHVTETNTLGQFTVQDVAGRTDHGSDNTTGQEEDHAQTVAESHESLEKGHTSSEESSMDQASESEYVPSQEQVSVTAEQPEGEKEGDKEEGDAEELVEEHVDLDYQIPEDTLRTAMLAVENTRASFWSHTMYRGPDGQSLSTHYCRTKDVAERVAQYFLKEKVVGFDIEWRPFSSPYSIKQNASLIQLACENRIALFHISLFPGTTPEELMPPTLKTILESPDIYKVGVAVKGDFTRLQKFLNIHPQGVFELSRLHNVVEYHETDLKKQQSNKLTALAVQVLQHLQLPLYKGAQLEDDPADTANVRASDWSKPLTVQQIQYAAADAYAGFRLYHIIEWKRKQLRPTPPTRGICDYDAKAVPREKKPKKKAAPKKTKAADAVAEDSTSALHQDQETNEEGTEAEEVEEESEEGYETAPEEFVDSHGLEGPVAPSTGEPAAASNSNATDEEPRARKRVGRVNLSRLIGSDLMEPSFGYPVLPQIPENLDASTSSTPTGDPAESAGNTQAMTHPSNSPVDRAGIPEEDDEFADPDLEEALQVLDLDADGKLTETASLSATTINKHGHNASGSESIIPKTTSEAVEELRDTSSEAFEEQVIRQDVEITEFDVIDFEPEQPEQPSTTSPATSLPLTIPVDETLHSAKYNSASAWAQNYLLSTIPSPKSTAPSRIRATIPHLRAYHLWYHQNHSLDDVASELRDPTLPHSTVSGYILQAVTLERLEYDKDAMRDMLMGLPVGMRRGKWKWIAEKVGVAK
jgi:hypothetical protein